MVYLLGKLQATPLEKLCFSFLRLSSLFSQSRRPLQLASSYLLDVYLISIIISTRGRIAVTHDLPHQDPME